MCAAYPDAGWRGFKKILSVCLCLTTLVLSTACGLKRHAQSLTRRRVEVEVEIAENANLRWPLAVQVLILRDKRVLDDLQAQSASEWFDGRHEFFRDKRPNTQGCEDRDVPGVVAEPDRCWWEWTPGQKRIGPLRLTYPWDAQWAVVFADYRTDGDHRWLVDPRKNFMLVLGEDDFTVEQ